MKLDLRIYSTLHNSFILLTFYSDCEYLGCVNVDWQVEDDQNEPVGQIDPGRALVT